MKLVEDGIVKTKANLLEKLPLEPEDIREVVLAQIKEELKS